MLGAAPKWGSMPQRRRTVVDLLHVDSHGLFRLVALTEKLIMRVTAETLVPWCRTLLNANAEAPKLTLEQYLDGIGRLDSLADVARGTAVLVRGDLDAKPGPKVGEGDIR